MLDRYAFLLHYSSKGLIMQKNNQNWKENYQKVRNHEKRKTSVIISAILTLSVYTFQTILLQTEQGNLLPSQTALIIFGVVILIASTALFYETSLSIIKTYRDEGIALKANNASDSTMILFYNKMDRCFHNITTALTLATIVFSLLIGIALFHTYSLSLALSISGGYLIAATLIFPNICNVKARKKYLVECYDGKMNNTDLNNLIFEVAKIFRGDVVYSSRRLSEATSLSIHVAKAKMKFKIYMAIFAVCHIIISYSHFSTPTDQILLPYNYTVSTAGYFVTLTLINILFLFRARYLYTQVSSGNAMKRKKICKGILGSSLNKAG